MMITLASMVIAYRNINTQAETLELWMQKRVFDNQEIWEFPGGKLEDPETPPETAIRELKEETGIELSQEEINLLFIEPIDIKDQRIAMSVFITDSQKFPKKGWVKLKKDFHECLKTFPANYQIIDKVRDYLFNTTV